MEEPTELQKLQWENTALREALQYLVDTKKRKDTMGQDSIYFSRKNFGWRKAEQLLKETNREWLPFNEENSLSFSEAANKNCLCKFDDGTVCRYEDDHPFAVLTHFKPE